MPELAEKSNMLEALRSMTEEKDMNQYLKSNFGGYSKSSVLEYLNVLRKQQQSMVDNFSRDRQMLLEEKEQLKKNYEALKTRLYQMEAEYKNLSETIKNNQIDLEAYSVSDIISLKGNIVSLEDELKKGCMEKSRLEQQLQQRDAEIRDYVLRLEQANQEIQAVSASLKTQLVETKTLHGKILELTGTVEEKSEEIDFLKAEISEGRLSVLSEKISNLTQQLNAQTQMLNECREESGAKSQAIETLKAENDTLKQSITHLKKSLEEVYSQNEKLTIAHTSLMAQLEAQYQNILALINERSFAATEKLAAVRDLNTANAKIARLEQDRKKHGQSQASR